ncbi:unnamed protein product, partial [Brachionus calyciflorus]
MSQIMDSIDDIQLLEYKLHQDSLALTKIIKWEKSIKRRIESAKLQIQILKKERPKQESITNNLRLTETSDFNNSLTESSITKESTNYSKQVNKEVTKNSTPQINFNDCLNKKKINEQQKTIDNIQQ